MRPWLALLLVAVSASPAQAQQLVRETVEGLDRICTYRTGELGERTGELGEQVRDYRVGMNQPCPDTFPFIDPSLPAPASAALRSSSVSGGFRYCTYVQGPASWTFALPLTSSCPLAAGMARQIQDRARPSR